MHLNCQDSDPIANSLNVICDKQIKISSGEMILQSGEQFQD